MRSRYKDERLGFVICELGKVIAAMLQFAFPFKLSVVFLYEGRK